jgi:hypothetical protein
MRRQGILRCFLNVDLRNGHDGLAEIAKQNDIKATEIESGSYIVFINTQRTKLKMFAAGNVIAYLKMPQGDKINMNVIRELPTVFNGKSINYDKALKSAVEKAMNRKTKDIHSIA